MKQRKVPAFALMVVLLLTALVSGCGKASDTGNTPKAGGEETNSSQETSAPALEPYHLIMYYPGTATKDEKLISEEMSKYLQEKINATIDIKTIDWNNYNQKLNLMASSNEGFDILFTASWLQYASQVARKQIIELDGLLESQGKGIKENITPTLLQGAQIEKKLYAIPTNKETASHVGFILDKKLVEKYKFDVATIKTPEDLEPMLKVIKENEPDVIPFFSAEGHGLPGIANKIYDGIGDPFLAPEAEPYMQLQHKWWNEGYVNKDAATNKDAAATFKTGKVFAWVEQLKPGKAEELSSQLGIDLIQVDITKPITRTDDTTNSMLAISRTSKDPERAMMFLNLLHTDPYVVNLLDYGIEGTHYVKVSDKVIKYPDGMTAQNSPYNHGSSWMFGSQFLSYLFPNEDPEKWSKLIEYNKSAAVSENLGFTPNDEPVKAEKAAWDNVTKENLTAIYTGIVDPNETLKRYKEKLTAIGYEKIMQERQKQLEAFKNN